METISALPDWVANNESFLSGLAALIVVFGFLFTAFKYFQSTLGRSKADKPGEKKKLTLQDISAPSPHPIHFASVDGLRIAYNAIGSAGQTLIVCPGIVSNLHVAAHLPAMRDTINALTKFSRVLFFDKRGQGLSDTTANVARLDERVRDIKAVAEAAAPERFFLLGISEGGPMSIKYAHENPDKVKGLVLLGSTARFLKSEDYPIGFSEEVLDNLGNNWGKGKTRSIFFPGMGKDEIEDDVYAGLERFLADRESMRQIVDYMKTLDVRSILPEIQCPCLVVHFSGDLAIPVRMGRAIAESIPDCEFLEVGGIDHGDLAKSPVAVAAIKKFMEAQA